MNFLDKLKIVLKETLKESKIICLILFVFIVLAIISSFCSVEASADTELEFLNITNSQFNTGYKITANTRIVYDFEVDGLVSWTNYLSSGGTSYLIQSNSTPTSFSFFYSGNPVSRELELLSGRHKIIIDQGSLYLDNTFLCSSSSPELSWVGGLSFNNSDSHPEVFKIYDLKIYENDELVKHYKPYLQNNVYGFKEIVNSEFIEVENATGEEQFNLELCVSSNSPNEYGIHIYTQSLSTYILNNYKFYIQYPISGGISSWVNLKSVCTITSDNRLSYFATMNGVYKFKVEDFSGNVISSSTITVTNIVDDIRGEIDGSVLTPQLYIFIENADQDYATILIRTQSLDKSLINRYSCIYWVSSDEEVVYYPAEIREDGDKFYFEAVYHNKESFFKDTYYFKFYDNELKKYGNHVSIIIDRDYVLENADTYNKTPFLIKFLKYLFVPSESFFNSNINTIKSNIGNKIPYDDYIKIFGSLENISSDSDNIIIDFPEYKISDDLVVKQDKFIDFSIVLKYRDIWYSWVRGFIYIFIIIYNINQINKLLRGINISNSSGISIGGAKK